VSAADVVWSRVGAAHCASPPSASVEFHLLVTLAWMAGLLVVFVPLALCAYARRI
jgi:hypothetical protein